MPRHKAVAQLKRTLKKGVRGQDVVAVARALSKWEHQNKLGSYHEHPTALYGTGKSNRVRRFQNRHGLVVDGQYGQTTHKKMLPFFDAWGAKLMQEYTPKAGPSGKRAKVVSAAMFAYAHAPRHYTQDMFGRAPYLRRITPPNMWSSSDCSGFALWCLWLADVKDCGPYDGWTGSMQEHGKVVSRGHAQPGDMAFYVNHVAVIVHVKDGDIKIVSMGHDGGPFYVSLDYRSDLQEIRSYIG